MHTGGEDAYFISKAGHGALGVSDGVSAWAEDGIDPGEYSRTLVQYCAEAFEERVLAAATAVNKGAFISKFDPRSILRYAQQCTCKPGSATMVIAAMQPQGKLHVANLGDCGVKVVREGRVVFETKPQQHDFNLPYQLSHPQLFPDTDTADSADRWAGCWARLVVMHAACGCCIAGSGGGHWCRSQQHCVAHEFPQHQYGLLVQQHQKALWGVRLVGSVAVQQFVLRACL